MASGFHARGLGALAFLTNGGLPSRFLLQRSLPCGFQAFGLQPCSVLTCSFHSRRFLASGFNARSLLTRRLLALGFKSCGLGPLKFLSSSSLACGLSPRRFLTRGLLACGFRSRGLLASSFLTRRLLLH